MMMVGLLIIAHEPLASALASCAKHVYTCDSERAQGHVRTLDVLPNTDAETTLAQARALVDEVDSGSGVLVLTDVLGGTPGNIAARLADPRRVAVVAGVNLPMLLRALCYRDGKLAETVEKAVAGGTQGIMQVVSTPVQNQTYRNKGNDQARLHHQQ
jgi:PTS system ascorbate-specific IIA component